MSHRITKYEAANLARQLVVAKQPGVDALKLAYQQKAYELYQETMPKEVLACFKKHPNWFGTSVLIYLNSFGFSREWINCPDGCEVVEHHGNSELKLTRETASELIRAKRAWEKEADSIDKLRNDIRVALINLHTYKRIIEQFPEAEPLLPKKYSPPAVNYNSLKPVIKELATDLKKKVA